MANRFWVGGTGTWDATSTTHWSASTGGSSGASVPGASDNIAFDNNSGGGTVTVATDVNSLILTMGAFTGTLDFSTNNNNVTIGTFSGTGTGVRTLNMGNGTWTITGTSGTIWSCSVTTNFTLNANSSILKFTGSASATRTVTPGSVTYATVEVDANSGGGNLSISQGLTCSTFTVTGPNFVTIGSGLTVTASSLSISGSSGSPVFLSNTSITGGTAAGISVASGTPTITWAALRVCSFSGGATFNATNSFDLGENSGVTITAPSTSGGGLLVNPGLSGGMAA